MNILDHVYEICTNFSISVLNITTAPVVDGIIPIIYNGNAMKTLVKQSVEERWLRRHFSELVKKRAGKYVVVANDQGFVGDLQASLEKAREHYPHATPLIMKIPKEKDFLHVLIHIPIS